MKVDPGVEVVVEVEEGDMVEEVGVMVETVGMEVVAETEDMVEIEIGEDMEGEIGTEIETMTAEAIADVIVVTLGIVVVRGLAVIPVGRETGGLAGPSLGLRMEDH